MADDTGPAADRRRMIQRVREHWLGTQELIRDLGAVMRMDPATVRMLEGNAWALYDKALNYANVPLDERKLPEGPL